MLIGQFWERFAYVPLEAALIVREQDGSVGAAEIRRAIWSVQPSVAIPMIETMAAVKSGVVAGRRFQLWMVLLFAGSALALAMLGIYGVVSYGVSRRMRELGLRLALGATRNELFLTVLGQGLMPAALGLGAGLVAALLLGRLLASFLFGVKPADPVVFATTGLALLATAGLACALPARRAMRADPARTLRAE
ncbi:MAG: FtsX-like permease family protein [Terriglobales bacterium]